MSVRQELYPFSTQDRTAIPFDILNPSALVLLAPTTAAWTSMVLDSKFEFAIISATEDTVIDTTGVVTAAPSDGVIYTDWLFIPKEFAVTAVLKVGTIKVRALTANSLVRIQGIYRWQNLGLDRQYSKGIS